MISLTKHFTLTFFVLVLLFLWSSSSPAFECGTKSPYTPGNLTRIATPTGCTAVHISALLRHGSRYPSSGTRMYDLLAKINEVHKSKPFTYRNLTIPWSLPSNYKIASSSELSEAGSQEVYHIGQRFKSRFSSLLGRKYWNRYYTFVTTDKLRTARTAAAFSYGLFEGDGILGEDKYQPVGIAFSGPKDNDKELRYYKTCPLYTKEIKEGNGKAEWKKFGLGEEMKRVITNLERRLEIEGRINLTADMAESLFHLCCFATLNHEGRDWCSLFSQEDVEVFNYYDDLDNYYSHSYGNEISYKPSCPLLGKIVDDFNNFAQKKQSYPYGTFRFVHSGAVSALQSLLGMYQDSVPLRADNFALQKNRTYRISKNVPMAANLAFVLYKCDEGGYKVQVLVNERPAVLPCCDGGSVCSLTKFMSCYESIGKDCDFDAMCEVHPVASSQHLTPLWWALPLLTVLGATYLENSKI